MSIWLLRQCLASNESDIKAGRISTIRMRFSNEWPNVILYRHYCGWEIALPAAPMGLSAGQNDLSNAMDQITTLRPLSGAILIREGRGCLLKGNRQLGKAINIWTGSGINSKEVNSEIGIGILGGQRIFWHSCHLIFIFSSIYACEGPFLIVFMFKVSQSCLQNRWNSTMYVKEIK